MAGAGYKLFNTGDVLTAAQVNTYLMEQTVMVFANAAARTTALSGVVSEGMISYLKDTNAVEVYDGSNWVSSDDPNAIQNTIVDAKGDLISATAADTPARLAVGNNGETLVPDSSTSTGLRWQPSNVAGRNVVIGGSFDIWQRGTSFTSVIGQYTADRWQGNISATSANCTVTQDTSVPNTQTKYSIKVQQVTSGATSVTEYNVRHWLEQQNIYQLLGQNCVLSFWYRSNKTGTHGLRIYGAYNTNGTDQSTSFTVSAADTWEKKTIAVTAFAGVTTASASPTAAGGIIDIGFRANGNGFTSLSTNDYFQIAQVQLEVGFAATAFTRAGGTLAGELAACQRYYSKSYNLGTAPATVTTDGIVIVAQKTTLANADAVGPMQWPVKMRTAPTVTIYSFNGVTARVSNIGGTDLGANSGTTYGIGDQYGYIYNNTGGTIAPGSGGFMWHYVASAEL